MRTRRWMCLGALGFVYLLFFSMVSGAEVSKTCTFSKSFRFGTGSGYDIVELDGLKMLLRPGEPMLPYLCERLVIPHNAVVTGIEVVTAAETDVLGSYTIHPAQPPRVWGAEQSAFVPPDPDVYALAIYPVEPVELVHCGSMGGYNIVDVFVYPLRYKPSACRLVFHPEISFKVQYEETAVTKQVTVRQRDWFEKEVSSIVSNPEDVYRYAPPVNTLTRSDQVEYCIITSSSFVSYFQQLATWKTKKGIPSKVFTTSWIYSNYSGADNQEKIRNFIIDMKNTKGALWVLIGGDVDVVPCRMVYAADVVNNPPWCDTIACDLYFADLDGDWDANNNGVYGQMAGDNVDMYSDINVGRAPVSTTQSCQAFVNKVLTYEKNPLVEYIKKMLLPAVAEYGADQGNDTIALITPSGWQDSKLYERYGNLNQAAVRDSLNTGFGFCHFVAHGNQYQIFGNYVGLILDINDALALSNYRKYTICNAICCFIGAFDITDCIVEYMMSNSQGGSVCFIANDRYGMGDGTDYTFAMNIQFYRNIFEDGMYYVGESHSVSKDACVPQSVADKYMRYCLYELNLFGDPVLQMWTDEPVVFSVTHDTTTSVGSSVFGVYVEDDTGVPVESAYVCCMCKFDTMVYKTGYTDNTGSIAFDIEPSVVGDTMWVTVTKQNFYPYESYAIVDDEGVYENTSTTVIVPWLEVYPCPFENDLHIRCQLPVQTDNMQDALVNLEIYSVTGQLVRRFPQSVISSSSFTEHNGVSFQSACVTWNGTDEVGRSVPAGVYFVRLKVNEYQDVEKAILLK